MKEDTDFLMDITISDEVYVIKSYKNEERPEDQQMSVVMRNFSGKDLGEISNKTISEVKKIMAKEGVEGEAYKQKFMETYDMIVKKYEFIYKVRELRNFKFKINDKIKEFTDARELYEYEQANIASIVQEMYLHFDGLDKLYLKNL